MMFPENMARFLAAMNDSMPSMYPNALFATNGSSDISNRSGISHHHHQHRRSGSSPRSFSSQPSISEETGVKISSINGNESDQSHDLSSPGLHQLNNKNISDNSNSKLIITRSSSSRQDVDHSSSNSAAANSAKNKNIDNNSNSLLRNTRSKTKGKSADFDLTSFPVIREGLLGKGSGPVDYTRYVKRYESCTECGYQHCRDLNYKEHFHCLQCFDGARVFIKKDEMIRHFKWHKKRDESLQHGFMRYSSSDNCADRFSDCPHNRKQTHYHCIHDGCKKVYVSTSDVQMHSNYHRKDSAIIQEGFQRFRAMEDCRAEHCSFRHQQTTHFHCRRESCLYTFKNKADMEKHKAYHAKGEQMSKDGFKKFMKHEDCNYSSCRFARVCNHIHCIREGCNYVLHSSGQLYSHKRKHERRDSEIAYRRFKLAQSIMRGTFLGADLSNASWNESLPLKSDDELSHSSSIGNDDRSNEDKSAKMEQCNCDEVEVEHFHCRAECCDNAIFPAEIAAEHGRNHELEDRISSLAYFTVDPSNFDAQDATIPCVSAKCVYQNTEKHYHCLWNDCTEIILPSDSPFKRLEHFKSHETNQKLELLPDKDDLSLDGFFRKKRGRPHKNRTIEVPGPNESIFTSFKLPKPRLPGASPENEHPSDTEFKDPIGFTSYHAKSTCPDPLCIFNNSSCSHYHCAHPRCHFAVKDMSKLSCHLRDFHSNIDILDGYEYFDQSSSCHNANCEFNEKTNHFHCTRDDYAFERYFSMAIHDSECHESKSNIDSSDDEDEDDDREEDEHENEQLLKKHDKLLFQSKVNNNNENHRNGSHPMDLSSVMPSSTSNNNKDIKSKSDHSLNKILQIKAEQNDTTEFGPDFACGRPFCKLKRKNHFHCDLCNQAFSELDKLRSHILKHKGLTTSSSEPNSHDPEQQQSDNNTNKILHNSNNNHPIVSTPSQLDLSLAAAAAAQAIPTAIPPNFLNYPASHSPYLFLQHHPFSSLYAGMMYGQNYPPTSQHDLMSQIATMSMPKSSSSSSSSLLQTSSSTPVPELQDTLHLNNNNNNITNPLTPLKRPPSNTSSPSSPSENKKQKMQLRMLKDEPVPEGYVRFRFNEDCAYEHCGYREHQTHFHCIREDCGYSFCDKTRFVQHTARHDRLDSLMGGDFKQYRANVACGRNDCTYIPTTPGTAQGQQNKASHFHCCKCDYVCTDTNKVVAHRRQHQKMESITAAGFEKFTPSQICNDESCVHIQKQTHYHCTQCNFSVLGLSQMSAHKYRHEEEMNKK